MGETAIAKRGYKSVVRESWGAGQMSEVRDDPKFPSEIDIKLHAAMPSRSRDRARSVDICWRDRNDGHEVSIRGARLAAHSNVSMTIMVPWRHRGQVLRDMPVISSYRSR
jgi:hypothetical protein